ncbi:hypothetical protein GCM10010358_62700 [Streptomyces minutiscleroticus]|uniref:Uncharacterized protein n=1 Tax=Streptomyces minutiscleroticus TaxID=68238 RepID=A0A918U621_9ACTN|nr:hypothetical protein GCM10010358_62700 [Streptomyces minutiscleroticus]
MLTFRVLGSRSPAGQGPLQRGRVDQPVTAHGQHRHPYSVQAPQHAAGGEHGGVLRGLGDHVRARAAGGEDGPAQREQVGLGAGAGEDDLVRTGPEQGGHLLAGRRERGARPVAVGVGAGGVAEELGEVGQHRPDDARVDRGGGVVVEVDRPAGQARVPRRTRCHGLLRRWR